VSAVRPPTRPAAGSVTDDDDDDRQQTLTSITIRGPLGGPVITDKRQSDTADFYPGAAT